MVGSVSALALVAALRDPSTTHTLDREGWTSLLTAARAERLMGALATRLDRRSAPAEVAAILDDADAGAAHERRGALWEAEMARRALVPLGCPVVLLKGTAFAAAGLDAGRGRAIGDLDILVPRAALDAAEAALRAAGWEPVKADAYDDEYYRRWMHELPPLIHRARDRMIDVHHTILPTTARPTPDAAALIASAVPLGNGLAVLSPADMVVHAAAHLFADGDLAGGLRNLWDIDRLCREFADDDADFWTKLGARARLHGLVDAVGRALRLAADLYATPVPAAPHRRHPNDAVYRRRLLARDGWGRQTRPVTRLAFYVRSHWLRMPPHLLARHLLVKAWRGRG
ncbi:nucleotidyltransferase family protein [Sphingomonas sp.]|uniref:nucleotidyltransferase domain-containing protein n=1 Tax=Sphingomonas sp. TaxID=28214 RepID=UPI003B009489